MWTTACLAAALAACARGAPTASVQAAPAAAQFSAFTPPAESGPVGGISDKAARADRLWERRLEPEALAEAIALWRELLADHPNQPIIRAALMRAYLFAAEGPLMLGDQRQSMQATLRDAIALAENALVAGCLPLQAMARAGLSPLAALPTLCGVAEGPWLFWYAAALTDYALATDVTVLLAWHKPLAALWQALMTRNDLAGDAHAYLGALYALSPRFAGGDLPLGRVHLEQALRLQQGMLRTRLWFAEYVLVPEHKHDAAARMLQQIADAPTSRGAQTLPEQHLAQLRARQLLERLAELL